METTNTHYATGYRRIGSIDEPTDNSASIRRFEFLNWCFFSVLNIINTVIYLAGFCLAVHLSDRLEKFYLIGMLGIALLYVVLECIWLGCTMGNMREGYMFSKSCSIVTIALFTALLVILGVMEQLTVDRKFYLGISLLVIGMTFECIVTMCAICFAEVYRNMQQHQRVAIIDDTESILEPQQHGYNNPMYGQTQPGLYPPYPSEYYPPNMHMHAHQSMNPRVVVPAEVHPHQQQNPVIGVPIGASQTQRFSVTSSVP